MPVRGKGMRVNQVVAKIPPTDWLQSSVSLSVFHPSDLLKEKGVNSLRMQIEEGGYHYVLPPCSKQAMLLFQPIEETHPIKAKYVQVTHPDICMFYLKNKSRPEG